MADQVTFTKTAEITAGKAKNKTAPKAPSAATKAATAPVVKVAAPKAAPTAPVAKAKAKAAKAATAPTIHPLALQVVAWVEALPKAVTFYRNAVAHHRKQGTTFPRDVARMKAFSQSDFDAVVSRTEKKVNANGFTDSKALFDIYVCQAFDLAGAPIPAATVAK